MFNSLKYVKILEEVGLTRAQAETHIEIMTEIVETNLATKQDLKDLSVELKHEIKDLRSELRQDIQELRSEVKSTEHRLIIKLGTIVTLAIGAAVTIARLV